VCVEEQLELARAVLAAALANFKNARGAPDESDLSAFIAYTHGSEPVLADILARLAELERRTARLEGVSGEVTDPEEDGGEPEVLSGATSVGGVLGRRLTGADLAERLGVKLVELRRNVTRARGDRQNFAWTRQRDPEGIGWVLRARDRYEAVLSSQLRDEDEETDVDYPSGDCKGL